MGNKIQSHGYLEFVGYIVRYDTIPTQAHGTPSSSYPIAWYNAVPGLDQVFYIRSESLHPPVAEGQPAGTALSPLTRSLERDNWGHCS